MNEINVGTFICDYTGEVFCSDDLDRRGKATSDHYTYAYIRCFYRLLTHDIDVHLFLKHFNHDGVNFIYNRLIFEPSSTLEQIEVLEYLKDLETDNSNTEIIKRKLKMNKDLSTRLPLAVLNEIRDSGERHITVDNPFDRV